MTIQDIIKQTESFTIEQKRQLAYYFFLSTISEEQREQYINLFHYNNNIETKNNSDDVYNSIVEKKFKHTG